MRVDTFIAFSAVAIVGISIALITTVKAGDERYMHHCSTNAARPTVVGPEAMTKGISSVMYRRYHPGGTPKLKIINSAKGQHVKATAFIKGVRRVCHFRSTGWEVAFKSHPFGQ